MTFFLTKTGFDNIYVRKRILSSYIALIDKARAMGRTLYVVVMEISNAFPSTELAALWTKLKDRGASGLMIDHPGSGGTHWSTAGVGGFFG